MATTEVQIRLEDGDRAYVTAHEYGGISIHHRHDGPKGLEWGIHIHDGATLWLLSELAKAIRARAVMLAARAGTVPCPPETEAAVAEATEGLLTEKS